jgi:hypothetical protein
MVLAGKFEQSVFQDVGQSFMYICPQAENAGQIEHVGGSSVRRNLR